MLILSFKQTVEYLDRADIDTTKDVGHATIYTGKTVAGQRFVLVDDHCGDTVVIEELRLGPRDDLAGKPPVAVGSQG